LFQRKEFYSQLYAARYGRKAVTSTCLIWM